MQGIHNLATCLCFWHPVFNGFSPHKLPSNLRSILVHLDVKDRLNIGLVSELIMCVCTVQILHYQLCPAVRVNAEYIFGTCTLYHVYHCISCTYCIHGVHCCHPLHVIWCRSQYNCALLYGSRRTQMWHISQKSTANSTKLDTVVQVPCTKAALCFGQQPFNTLVCQESALHFNHALPILSVLYSIHLLHIIVLCTS